MARIRFCDSAVPSDELKEILIESMQPVALL